MKKWNYYNDNDPAVCEWARELIRAKLVPDGEVDCRSITDIKSDDINGFVQCHFFCGILGWSLALRLAGWPDDEPVWTGSCPCQPLSGAGQRKGHADKRHLWPAFYRLIAKRKPATVFGEQVAGTDGREWLAGVRADLEGAGYAVGASDLCAASVGAPHRRARIYWVADSDNRRWKDRWPENDGTLRAAYRPRNGAAYQCPEASEPGASVADSVGDSKGRGCGISGDAPQPRNGGYLVRASWTRFETVLCRDGKTRRFESGSFPLADGIPGRMGLLRGYGNAIVPILAAEFIQAACESFR